MLRVIPHLGPDKANAQAGQATWVKPLVEAQGAQLARDAWTKAAEGWLLSRAGVPQGEELPYVQGAWHGARRQTAHAPPHRHPQAAWRGAWQGQGVGCLG